MRLQNPRARGPLCATRLAGSPAQIIAALIACMSPSIVVASSDTPPAPMVDGDCSEYVALGAHREALNSEITLSIYQDSDFYWLCYTLPPESFGYLDLRVESASLPKPLNLHVSAQLGEWLADDPNAAPHGPDSDVWWNNHGWIANWQWFHGVETSGTKPAAKFKLAPGREVQLSKMRFGSESIEIVLNIGRIRRPGGMEYSLRFPQTGTFPMSNGELTAE